MKYVFGYGSLMNPKSLARTIPGERFVKRGNLHGYRRKMNVPYDSYLYLNIVPVPDSLVEGVLIAVSDDELETLKVRERGYECVDVTVCVPNADSAVYAFIAPDLSFPELTIPQSYINTCIAGVPPGDRERWLLETVIENDIVDDTARPVYENIPVE